MIRPIVNRAGLDIIRVSRPKAKGDSKDLIYYETGLGKYYLPGDAPNDVIAKHMKAGKVFEPEVVAVARRFIRPGTAAIDAGANFGQMALLFSRLAGPEGVIYAIEAQDRVYHILRRNVEANAARNVVPLFKAAFNETGRVLRFPRPDLVRFGSYGSYNLPLAAAEGDPVESVRIDDLEIDRPVSFMKVDVQGCDLFAMQGAVETIARHRMPILFEFEQRFQEEYGTNFQDYVTFVASIGYEFTETVLDINYLIQPKS